MRKSLSDGDEREWTGLEEDDVRGRQPGVLSLFCGHPVLFKPILYIGFGSWKAKKIPTILFVGPVLFLSTVISRAEQSFKTVLQTALVKRGVGVTFADRNVYIQREVTLAE